MQISRVKLSISLFIHLYNCNLNLITLLLHLYPESHSIPLSAAMTPLNFPRGINRGLQFLILSYPNQSRHCHSLRHNQSSAMINSAKRPRKAAQNNCKIKNGLMVYTGTYCIERFMVAGTMRGLHLSPLSVSLRLNVYSVAHCPMPKIDDLQAHGTLRPRCSVVRRSI